MGGGRYSFNVDSGRQIFENQSFCQKSAEIFYSYFALMPDPEYESIFTSNEPTHYRLVYGDFIRLSKIGIYGTNEKLIDDDNFAKKKILSFRMNFIVILVGTINNQNCCSLGSENPHNASITTYYLVRVVKRRHNWLIFLWKWGRLNHCGQ